MGEGELGPILPIRLTIPFLQDRSKTVAHILGAETAMLDEPVGELSHVLECFAIGREVVLQLGRGLLLLVQDWASTVSGIDLLLLRCSLLGLAIASHLITHLRFYHWRSVGAR